MEELNVREVVGLIADECAPGERVALCVTRPEAGGGCALAITNAPSRVLDAVTDNGYHLSARYGQVLVTAEEA